MGLHAAAIIASRRIAREREEGGGSDLPPEDEKPKRKRKPLHPAARMMAIITSVLLVIGLLIVVLWVSSEYIEWRDYRAVHPLVESQEELIFPEGWQPFQCEKQRGQYAACQWICVNDQQVYQECDPVRRVGE